MKKTLQYIIFVFITSLIVISCSTKPQFPNEPFIKFESLSKTEVNVGDTVWLKLKFEDGDGDLGKPEIDTATCKSICEFTSDSSCYKDPFYGAFLIDMRDSCFVNLQLPNFEPDGKIKAVSGEVLLNIPPIFCKNGNCNNCIDKLVYKIILRDASGNYSNEVFSDTIYINCN